MGRGAKAIAPSSKRAKVLSPEPELEQDSSDAGTDDDVYKEIVRAVGSSYDDDGEGIEEEEEEEVEDDPYSAPVEYL